MTLSTATNKRVELKRLVAPVDGPAIFSAPWSFDALIWPMGTAEFCSTCWSRVPVHIQRSRPEFFQDLISLECIERYLSLEDIFRRPDTIFMRGYDFWSGGKPPRNLSEAYERMLRGQPLQLRNLERVLDPSTPLISLVRNMELALQHPRLSIGGYISRAKSASLGPHHDETEIFTLQIVGRKRWRLFYQVQTDKPGTYDPATLGPHAHEVLLEAGDALYHPRGWIHDVLSEDVPSFSITIVFEPITWKNVLDGIVERLGTMPPFMVELPAGVLLTERATEVLRRPLEERLQFLRDALSTVSVGEIVDDLAAKHVIRSTLPPDRRLDTLFQIDLLTLDSRLERRRDISTVITANADQVTLILPGGYQIHAPAGHESALHWILGADPPFRPREVQGPLSDEEKLALAKRLVASGLLTLASNASPRTP